eukprot:CAMPEP_0201714694 /NCGR_PEP_ID=MMETSP0593-20130828/1062_1 /ASSEMBLY_ACC=CAM_ASM_000672 /TAXON_ID=267983 /ORGANISM="Skeletonema japonicum, Strain CCMP2506" /LENGTH=509 /DNA_ID=CAMNT_0048203993 /DNA_START=18 /DNA_END=1547 /DNA_ORIENTATION=-
MTSWMNNNFVPSASAAGSIGQYYPQNESEFDYASNSSSSIDEPATHNSSSSSQPPPRPQRPFTEYNVFFRLERELLLQGKSDDRDDLEQSKAELKILSSSKEIESSDVAAHRPPQYRHLIMPTDWMVVGSSVSKIIPSESTSFDRSANDKNKETRAKFTFLELTKLISSRWREVCQNDPETKVFCKKIANTEAARYREELEEYRAKYGLEAAKGKKRKSRRRKSPLLHKSQKKSKQVTEEGKEIDMLNNFVPIEDELEEEFRPSPASDLEGGRYTTGPDLVNMMYARQHELQAQLEQSQRRLASLPSSSSFTINTFQGIPKNFSQAQIFQGAIITPSPPSADRYEQGRQMLQDGYNSLQRLSAMRHHTSQSFVRRNSAFDSKYDFLNSGDGAIDDDKVEEYLREFERNVFQQLFQSSAYEDASGFGTLCHNSYLHMCHSCIEETRSSPTEVSQFHSENTHSETMTVTSNDTREKAAVPKIKKLRSLQTNDWVQFTEHVEIKDEDDIFRD